MVQKPPPAGSQPQQRPIRETTFQPAYLNGGGQFRFGVEVRRMLAEERQAQERLAARLNAAPIARPDLALVKARTSLLPTTVRFDHDTWQGRIGEEFTVHNVRRVVSAVIESMFEQPFLYVHGFKDLEDVRDAGMLVLADYHELSAEFSSAAIQELVARRIRVHRTDAYPVGDITGIIDALGAAGSLSFQYGPRVNAVDRGSLRIHTANGATSAPAFLASVECHANTLMDPTNSYDPANPSLYIIGERTHYFHLEEVMTRGMDAEE